ncbi:MAG: cell envelope integrity EipB family protein [Geminicoccaceae bacterium]
MLRFALIAAVMLPGVALAAPPVDLLSHRAAYRLSLASSDNLGGIVSVRGALVLEWRAECDGSTSQQRLGFVADTDEGQNFAYDVRFSSWESNDAKKMRFATRSFDDNKLKEEFRGSATIDPEKGEVRYEVPSGKVVSLPAGTVFPTRHIVDLIQAAKAGERFVAREVFDGAGPDAINRVTAVIGQPRQVKLAAEAGEETRWPVSLAYYENDEGDGSPTFQISFQINEGGVLNDVRLDYGEFSLKGELQKLERLPGPTCD